MSYRLARGVRLQHSADGAPVLLIPEGIVTLNDSAAATLQLLDGSRDAGTIAELLAKRFEAEPSELTSDVLALLDDFVERGFVTT